MCLPGTNAGGTTGAQTNEIANPIAVTLQRREELTQHPTTPSAHTHTHTHTNKHTHHSPPCNLYSSSHRNVSEKNRTFSLSSKIVSSTLCVCVCVCVCVWCPPSTCALAAPPALL